MARFFSFVAVLALLLVPLALAPPVVHAQSSMTIFTVERGSGDPALYACYSVLNLGAGGGTSSACDGHDGAFDGATTLTTNNPCTNCRISQSLPDDPDQNPTQYLREQPLEGVSWGGPYTFSNYLKPYLVVSVVDAVTGQLVPGAKVGVSDLDLGGGVDGGTDGSPFDHDGLRDGKFQSKRLGHAGNYRVVLQSPPPAGYVLGAQVEVDAEPAETGEFTAVTLEISPVQGDPARIAVTTIDKKSKKKIKGACYAVSTQAGSELGEFCDGATTDADGSKNGVVRTGDVTAGIRYVIDQTSIPRKYKLVRGDKEITTVEGQDAKVTFKNARKR